MTCYQRSGKLPVAKTRKLIVEPPKKMTYRWLQSIMATIILTIITILTMTKIKMNSTIIILVLTTILMTN